jgi:hypothetical protein
MGKNIKKYAEGGYIDNLEDIAVRGGGIGGIHPKMVIDIKTPRGPTKRVTGRVSAEDTMNDIGMRNSAGAPDGTVEVGPLSLKPPMGTSEQELTGMKKGGAVKKFARGGGIEVRGKTRGRIC